MSHPIHCDLCSATISPHAHYIVRIDVLADPSIPEMATDDLEAAASEEHLALLLQQMETMSEAELQDQVHRHFEYTLCGPCQRKFLANPLGRPRSSAVTQKQGQN